MKDERKKSEVGGRKSAASSLGALRCRPESRFVQHPPLAGGPVCRPRSMPQVVGRKQLAPRALSCNTDKKTRRRCMLHNARRAQTPPAPDEPPTVLQQFCPKGYRPPCSTRGHKVLSYNDVSQHMISERSLPKSQRVAEYGESKPPKRPGRRRVSRNSAAPCTSPAPPCHPTVPKQSQMIPSDFQIVPNHPKPLFNRIRLKHMPFSRGIPRVGDTSRDMFFVRMEAGPFPCCRLPCPCRLPPNCPGRKAVFLRDFPDLVAS